MACKTFWLKRLKFCTITNLLFRLSLITNFPLVLLKFQDVQPKLFQFRSKRQRFCFQNLVPKQHKKVHFLVFIIFPVNFSTKSQHLLYAALDSFPVNIKPYSEMEQPMISPRGDNVISMSSDLPIYTKIISFLLFFWHKIHLKCGVIVTFVCQK